MTWQEAVVRRRYVMEWMPADAHNNALIHATWRLTGPERFYLVTLSELGMSRIPVLVSKGTRWWARLGASDANPPSRGWRAVRGVVRMVEAAGYSVTVDHAAVDAMARGGLVGAVRAKMLTAVV